MSESEAARLPAPACRAREVLDRVGDKWSVYVVTLLGHGTHRFSELKRSIGFITQRMLTITLRGLERDGLVTRTVYPTVPIRVEYSLTPLGESLLQTLRALLQWSLEHVDEIDLARQRYDRAHVQPPAPVTDLAVGTAASAGPGTPLPPPPEPASGRSRG